MRNEVNTYASREEAISATAAAVAEVIGTAIGVRDRATVALSGGSTPRELYRELSSRTYRDATDWRRVCLFAGDERMVPSDDPESNWRMIREALVDRVPIPAENIRRIRGELTPEEAAAEYSRDLAGAFPDGKPRFDLILLGLGTDGHTASIFPGTDAVRSDEATPPAIAVRVPRLDAWRVTLSLPVLNAAREIVFLVTGTEKAEIVARAVKATGPMPDLPATLVRPESGRVRWMLDREAAARIRA